MSQNCCCCSGQEKETPQQNYTSKCPECNTAGKLVQNTVVKNFVAEEYRNSLRENQYYACLDPDCKVGYFGETNAQVFYLNNLEKPIWFKHESYPKIACYCNNISYQQIYDAVNQHGLKSWKSIVLHYKNKSICKCEVFNPTGECCTENFYAVINKALQEKGKEKVQAPEDCCN